MRGIGKRIVIMVMLEFKLKRESVEERDMVDRFGDLGS